MSIKKLVFSFAVMALFLGLTVAPASAITEAELRAEIARFEGMIAQLQGGGSTGLPASSCNFTTDLSTDMAGNVTGNPVVICLQNYLKSTGHFPSVQTATGYYGPITVASVKAWQTANGVAPAAGYFGKLSQDKYYLMTAGSGIPPYVPPDTSSGPCTGGALFNSVTGASCTATLPAGCTSTTGFSPTTGQSCSGTSSVTYPAGCTSAIGFSVTTGQSCATVTPDNGLTGSAGSVSEYDLMSSLSSEEVGEDEEDAQVAGLEIEADDSSDLALTAVRLVFDEAAGATEDFDNYAAEVSVWLDGKEVARVDGSKFDTDNEWTRTLSLDSGAVIKAGETSKLVVAITGVNNLDTNDSGDHWNVDFRSIRFVDGLGASTSEDPTTAARDFSFVSFATAADSELKLAAGDESINDPHTIEIEATQTQRNVALASFTLEAEGDSDLKIRKLGALLTVGGAATNVDDVIAGDMSPAIELVIDGQAYGTVSYCSVADPCVANTTDDTTGTTENVVFDDVDFVIPAGGTVNVIIQADIPAEDIAGIANGDTITVTLGNTELDNGSITDIDDESGENLDDGDNSGSVTAGANELRSTGIIVTLIDVDDVETAAGTSANDDVVTKHIKYKVTAFGGTVFVANTELVTTVNTIPDSTIATNGIRYRILVGGTATTAGLTDSTNVTLTSSGVVETGLTNNVIEIPDDGSATFDLSVTKTNSAANVGGTLQVFLQAIGWATTDSATFNVYDFNLEDYKTPITPSN